MKQWCLLVSRGEHYMSVYTNAYITRSLLVYNKLYSGRKNLGKSTLRPKRLFDNILKSSVVSMRSERLFYISRCSMVSRTCTHFHLRCDSHFYSFSYALIRLALVSKAFSSPDTAMCYVATHFTTPLPCCQQCAVLCLASVD